MEIQNFASFAEDAFIYFQIRDHSLFMAGGGLVISIINQIENS